jgi:hypothetical protein
MQAVELITDSLRIVGILSEIDTASAEQGAIGVTRLNDLMASLAEDGIDLGYAPLTDSTDDVLLPLGHVGAVKYMLGLLLCVDYGVDPQPMCVDRASSGYERLLRQAIHAQMQPTIPRLPTGDSQGSGVNFYTGT